MPLLSAALARGLRCNVHELTELGHVIGDMPNDVLMFALSGLSIAMGQASEDVKRSARRVTKPNTQEGFAEAIERYVLNER